MTGHTLARIRVRPLTHGEHETLLRWVKNGDSMPDSLTRRARVILLASYDISAYVIALLVPMGRNNVTHWIRRFNQEGLTGLRDRPRPGRPRHQGPSGSALPDAGVAEASG
jgi:hypothetical protein